MRVDSYLSSNCYIGKSGIEGLGVFAKKKIKKGDMILIWGGRILSSAELANIVKKAPEFDFFPVEVANGFYIAPSNIHQIDDAYRINHSCNPNAGIKGQTLVVARKDIHAGEEICFDYETSDIINMSFICTCGSKFCRKKINGNSWKKKNFQKKNTNFLSIYLKEMLRSQI